MKRIFNKTHIFKTIFLITAMVMTTTYVSGQSNPKLHKKNMDSLSFIKGIWNVYPYEKQEDGTFKLNQKNETKNMQVTFTPIFNGNYYRVNAKLGYNFSLTIGYDQWRYKYVMATFEDGPGLIDIYQGNFDEDSNLVLNNFEVGTHYVHSGVKYYNRMVFEDITEDGFSWSIDTSIDGTKWNRVSKYDLRRF